jgi:hypothetical protein
MVKQKCSPVTSQTKLISIVVDDVIVHTNPAFIMPVALFADGVGLGWMYNDITIRHLMKQGVGEFYGYEEPFLYNQGVRSQGEGYWYVPFDEIIERGVCMQIATKGMVCPMSEAQRVAELGEFIFRCFEDEWELWSSVGCYRFVKNLGETAVTGQISNGKGYTVPIRVNEGHHILIP